MSAPCPVCGSALSEPFLTRSSVPVHQNLLMGSPEEARSMPRGDLALAHCRSCDFVTNVAFEAQLLRYGEGYDNNQVCSPVFEGYVDELVARLVDGGLRGGRVVEVGCGNGYFLRKLVGRAGATGVGFDPSYRGPAEEAEGRLRFVTDLYGPRYACEVADLVVCRHVIEHIGDPVALLAAVRSALVSSPEALVVFETPAVEWILDGAVYQDFFYEHCSYFSGRSLAAAFSVAGFDPVRIDRGFGGQYLWLEAGVADGRSAHHGDAELEEAIRHFVAEEARQLEEMAATVEDLAADGGVAVWGAGAKGVTFLNLLDPDGTSVRCAVDINPAKQGRFVPGTGHPIVDVGQLQAAGARHAIVMNPCYLEEARGLAEREGVAVEMHPDGRR